MPVPNNFLGISWLSRYKDCHSDLFYAKIMSFFPENKIPKSIWFVHNKNFSAGNTNLGLCFEIFNFIMIRHKSKPKWFGFIFVSNYWDASFTQESK